MLRSPLSAPCRPACWQRWSPSAGLRRGLPLEIVTGLSTLIRFSLLPRGGGRGLLDDVESDLTTDRVVRLESAELEHRFRLMVADDDSEEAVHRLFSPAVIVEIVEQAPTGSRIEFRAGALVLGVPSHCFDTALLDALIDLGGGLARALTATAVRA